MQIALEYLHITHEEFKKLPRIERMKCILYEKMKRERQAYFDKKEADKIEEIKSQGSIR